jgi:hypothetical protein
MRDGFKETPTHMYVMRDGFKETPTHMSCVMV